jgi:hypothetical protein
MVKGGLTPWMLRTPNTICTTTPGSLSSVSYLAALRATANKGDSLLCALVRAGTDDLYTTIEHSPGVRYPNTSQNGSRVDFLTSLLIGHQHWSPLDPCKPKSFETSKTVNLIDEIPVPHRI